MRTALLLASALFCAAPALAKDVEMPAEDNRVDAPTIPAAFTVTGTVGPETYDRIFTSDVNNDCNATSSLSGSGVGVPYEVVPFHTVATSPEPLIAAINAGGTDIGDTVLSIYCVFDPSDATTDLVAYDDDGGGGLLSAFDGSEGVLIAPGRTYFAVVSTFSTGSVGGGNFTLDFGGDLVAGPFIPVPALPIPSSSMHSELLLGIGVLLVGGIVLVLRQRMS